MIGGRSSLLLGLCLTVLAVKQSMAIVGGSELPYFASIRDVRTSNHIGGAAIISGRTVVTAAHNVENNNSLTTLHVWAGSLNGGITSDTQIRPIDAILFHDGYVSGSTSNDIALIFVDQRFEFNAAVQPIPLPEASFTVEGTVMITGWPNLLVQGTYAPVVPNEICKPMLPPGVIDETNFCTGSFSGVGGICPGDHGSPTVKDGVLVGVSVRNPDFCKLTTLPSAHVHIPKKVVWIKNCMK